jgi:hypothetical protein
MILGTRKRVCTVGTGHIVPIAADLTDEHSSLFHDMEQHWYDAKYVCAGQYQPRMYV